MFTGDIRSNTQDQRGTSRLQPPRGAVMPAAQLSDDTSVPGGEDPRGRETLKSRRTWLWAVNGDQPAERLL